MAEFRLLGLVEIWHDGRPVDVGQPRQRSVLAALLVDAGRPVTLDTLVDRVWGELPPDGARHALHTYLGRIRRMLAQLGDPAPARLVHRSGVYVLEVDPDRVDLHRFRLLLDGARDPSCPDLERVARLREALDLWRGEPLAGLTGPWAARVRDGYRGQRLDAAVLWAQAELRVGDPAAVIGPLTDLAGEHPLVEPLVAVLMRALHAAGRTADAVDCHTAIRKRLVEELGADPGPELQAVYQAILRGAHGAPAPAAVPAQLPGRVPGFAGRDAELARLDALLDAAGPDQGGVVIAVLSGTAGVGKTALALHWAHRVADRFPDGQLYVNLRGFDPAGAAMSPTEAVRGFLDALEVPPQRVPAGVEAQVGLYRSLLAGRRVLVLLDNARDADQVRPLLPGSPGALVVVTSREQLSGLVAGEGAHPLSLDLLSTVESRALLGSRLGAARVAAEPRAVNEIIARCARLPLALVIVAGRAATYPDFPFEALADELRTTRQGLDAFDAGDPVTDPRAVFSWSYQVLQARAARLFRLLGLHPGPEISTAAAASLAGEPVDRVRRALTELTRAHLVTERVPDRFTLHDLLRAYAAELAQRHDPDRRAALHRMVDHYLHTAHAADLLLDPSRDPIGIPAAADGVTVPPMADQDQAMEWFTDGHATLMALLASAAGAGFDAQAAHLAWALVTFLDRRGHWDDQITAQRTALDATGRLADRRGQARAYRALGFSLTRLARYAEAGTHYQQALQLCEALDDPAGQAHTHVNLAWVTALQEQLPEALAHAECAQDLYGASGNRSGLAQALSMVGGLHVQLGDYRRALTCCAEALAVGLDLGDRDVAAFNWDSMGSAYRRLGQYDEAGDCYRNSLALYREMGDRYYEADVLTHLGENQRDAGDQPAASAAWTAALAILVELGHPDADQVREKLHELVPGS